MNAQSQYNLSCWKRENSHHTAKYLFFSQSAMRDATMNEQEWGHGRQRDRPELPDALAESIFVSRATFLSYHGFSRAGQYVTTSLMPLNPSNAKATLVQSIRTQRCMKII